MPAAMIADTASEASTIERNAASTVLTASGACVQAHGHRRDEAERALGADGDAGEVVAGPVRRLAAEPHEVAARR